MADGAEGAARANPGTGGGTEPRLELSPRVGDRVAKTTCYMCACRCGIDVHIRDDGPGGVPRIRHIEGNRDHPVNRGVLCAKGSSGVMQHLSPARLMRPLRRTGPRGSGEFEEISWEEALAEAAGTLGEIRARDPKKLAFFTGRDQSQSFTGWWAQQYGTPNYAAHGGFCSVNMAAGGIYTLGGAFWEFGQPDWERTRLFLLFGVAEDHDSNPIKRGLGQIKTRGAKVIAVNPVRTGYNAIADEWVGITPGTDGLFVLSLVHELLRTGQVDLDYLLRWSNAGWLVDRNPGAGFGLFLRDNRGRALVWDRETGQVLPFDRPGLKPALKGEVPSPNGGRAAPVFELLARKYLDAEYAPEAVAERCGVSAATIRRIAAELAKAAFEDAPFIDCPWEDFRGERHAGFRARPVAMHAMRGISAHSNGFQTARAIHLLQTLLGSVEAPGGFRFKPPYPKPVEAHPTPHCLTQPNCPLPGPHLGFPRSPDDLALDEDGNPMRIDKAFSWEAPLSTHGMMHMVISNAVAGDPYEIDCLFLYMANMAWNSSMNTAGVMEMLTAKREDGEYRIPKIIYSDAYSSEMVAYADLILPDTTYLERHDCISLLDRPVCEPDAAADAIRWPVVPPETQAEGRDVRGFQSVLLDLGARIGLPGFVDEAGAPKYADYADYMVRHERRPGVGPLAGWRGGDGASEGRGAPNPEQLARYIEAGGVWHSEVPEAARFMKPFNRVYQDWAVKMGFYDAPQPYVFQLYSEPLRQFQRAAEGHGKRQPPAHLRARIGESFDPLPVWWPPFEQAAVSETVFPLHAITQRPAAMYHAWGSQNAWLRQIHGENPLYVPQSVMESTGLKDGDWAWVISAHGRIRVPVQGMRAVNGSTVWTWNAIGKRAGAWALGEGAPETTRGFLLNHLIHELLPARGDGLRWSNSDPVTGQAAWYDLRVRLERAEPPAEGRSEPAFGRLASPVGQGPEAIAFGKED
ncbi:molybdopterin oxidoreductase family protein [Paralimibaculum aggregatum]|uniref:Molybdopterin oxidoreductase family protein n=1 Tax=Paralimibaculum aggregatum TaxID=3036245 RepID=A0ABQ6LGL3_9RHOB|nr:molybdopterin oxidoreductase family protein [Limibaculum sp. NKW23]GMG81189.1 molybdopterin oxidoreductase family protein [Limibaculum sp. NKW23]